MANVLPEDTWTRRPDLAGLMAALGPGNVRYVGGAVRDTLAGLPVKDIDCATPLIPQLVMSRLQDAEIKVIPTGIKHGTVTAILPGGPVEITTLRRDVSTDGRHATVTFATEWREDAARRDFTINALYADPETLEIYDYFAGQTDLAARRVRFIGDGRQRIREDHLRILRYFRFQARFGSQPADQEAESACKELSALLWNLSHERVAMELLNLLSLPDPSSTLKRMDELGVLAIILPEAETATLPSLISAETTQGIPADPLRRLAALIPADPELAEQVAVRLRLSAVQKKRLVSAAGRSSAPGDPRILAYRLGRDQAADRLLLTGADTRPLKGWEVPKFPLKGENLLMRGFIAGPAVARTLRAVEDRWVAEGFPDAARVHELLDQVLAK